MTALTVFYMFGNWGVLALRIAVGAVFLVHGPPKLKAPQSMAAGMGMSSSFVWALGLAETFGGLSVLLGFLTQLGALVLTIVLIGALYYKISKWSAPFTAIDNIGWEFDLVLLGATLALLTIGPGIISIDAALAM